MKWHVFVWILVFMAFVGCDQELPLGAVTPRTPNQFAEEFLVRFQEKRKSPEAQESFQKRLGLRHDILDLQFEPNQKLAVFAESLKLLELVPKSGRELEFNFESENIVWTSSGDVAKDYQSLVNLLRSQWKDHLGDPKSSRVAGFSSFLDGLYPESANVYSSDLSSSVAATVLLFLDG